MSDWVRWTLPAAAVVAAAAPAYAVVYMSLAQAQKAAGRPAICPIYIVTPRGRAASK